MDHRRKLVVDELKSGYSNRDLDYNRKKLVRILETFNEEFGDKITVEPFRAYVGYYGAILRYDAGEIGLMNLTSKLPTDAYLKEIPSISTGKRTLMLCTTIERKFAFTLELWSITVAIIVAIGIAIRSNEERIADHLFS